MNTKQFFKEFENVPRNDRFQMINTPSRPVSLFVIFKQLSAVRAQKKYFEDLEVHLLTLAEEGFKQLREKDGDSEAT